MSVNTIFYILVTLICESSNKFTRLDYNKLPASNKIADLKGGSFLVHCFSWFCLRLSSQLFSRSHGPPWECIAYIGVFGIGSSSLAGTV